MMGLAKVSIGTHQSVTLSSSMLKWSRRVSCREERRLYHECLSGNKLQKTDFSPS